MTAGPSLCTVRGGGRTARAPSPRFIRRLIAERRIEFVKVGRHVPDQRIALDRLHRVRCRQADDAAQLLTRRGGLMPGAKKKGRQFGSIRKLPSGRYQASYRGPDGELRPLPHLRAQDRRRRAG